MFQCVYAQSQVMRIETPMLVLMGQDIFHPSEIAREITRSVHDVLRVMPLPVTETCWFERSQAGFSR